MGKTKIGFGSPNKEGSHDCHGAPLGEAEVLLTKKALGMSEEKFFVPQEVRDIFAARLNKMKQVEAEWNTLFLPRLKTPSLTPESSAPDLEPRLQPIS